MKIKTKHIRYIAPICIIAMFFLPSITHANGFVDFVSGLFGNVASGPLNAVLGFFKSALSTILSDTVTPLLNAVMSYQNFFTNGVNAGWTATRDFANLFFALILLFIAIATVLNTGGLDNFTAKRMLPKFIFAALLINFSKAIVGFLIDISQIIMISLYNTFGPTLTDSIGSASKISQAATESPLSDAVINLFTIILIVILIFVFLWTAMILVVRIITLWFVIMTSPLAFVSSMIPGLSSFYNDWKTKLQEALVTGPVLMFLLYLAVTVMNAGVNPNEASGGNLLDNGNILNYVLVIGLVISANIQAQKAGQQGPPIISKAVGVAGTIATLGIGGYIGAGGYNTNQLRKKTVELADKGAGGVTNITGQNARYESAKKDFKDRQAKGTGMFGAKKVNVLGRDMNINPLSATQGWSAEGKKNQQEDYDEKYAEQLASQKKLDEPRFARYKKIFSTSVAKEIKDLTDDNISITELREKLFQAKKKDNLKEKIALTTRITELGKLGELGKDDKSGSKANEFFVQMATENGSEGEFTEALVSKVIETNNAGVSIQDTTIATNLRDRLERVGGDKKGQKGFVGNIKTPGGANPKALAAKVIEKGIVNGIEDINNNPNVMRERVGTPGNYAFDTNGNPQYKPADQEILAFVESGNMATLTEPKTWQKLNKKSKDEFLTVLTAANIAASVPGSPNAGNQPKYDAAINAMK